MNIVQLDAETLPRYRQALAALMLNAIQHKITSALHPSHGQQVYQAAERYFHSLRGGMARHELFMWIALTDNGVAGSVQLSICQRPGGRNRAEVLQLLLHSTAKHEPIGRELMHILERKAESNQRNLLYLDVPAGSPIEAFYRTQGYHYLGELPDYALCADGHPHPGAIYYKRLRASAAETVATSH